MAQDKHKNTPPVLKNKRASFEYSFLETFVAGIALTGTEIKSLRNGKAELQDAYCVFQGTELFVINFQISPYEFGSYNNPPPKRPRKLLLTKRELARLKVRSEEKGLTIVPTRLFFNDRGLAKMEIALAKGKKLYDKRETIKERDLKREMGRKEE